MSSRWPTGSARARVSRRDSATSWNPSAQKHRARSERAVKPSDALEHVWNIRRARRAGCRRARASWFVFAAASRAGIGGHGFRETTDGQARAVRSHGARLRRARHAGNGPAGARAGHRPHAIQHRRQSRRSRTRSRFSRARATVTSRSRTTATSSTRPSFGRSSRTRARSSRRPWTRKSSCIASRRLHAASGQRNARGRARGVEGAYCLVVIIGERFSLRATRAAGGRSRWAKLDGAIVFASEIVRARHRRRDSIARSRAGRDRRRRRVMACAPYCAFRAHGARRRCVFEYVYFARPDSRVLRRLGRPRAPRARPAARARVPRARRGSRFRRSRLVKFRRAWGSRRSRGCPTSSRSSAITTSAAPSSSRISPDATQKVKVKYNPVREVLEGKSVVMVDDSIVRGTTTRGLVALVRGRGRARCTCAIRSPPVTGPCYYGIDTPIARGAHRRQHDDRRDRRRTSASTRSATCRSTAC